MKKTIFALINLIFILISCDDNTKEKDSKYTSNRTEVKAETQSVVKSEIPKFEMNKEILISLFDNIDNESYINNKITSIDFRKRANGVYISQEEAAYNKPKHWIHVNNLGDLSSVSFSTSDKVCWDKMIKELQKVSPPKAFDDKTSSKSIRYAGKIYTFESYEPQNGINLNLNDLYQIFILKTIKK